jgi:hypothetical protein
MLIKVIKVLSENDVGATKTHQAGFLVPKDFVQKGLFTALPDLQLNPRVRLKIYDEVNDNYFNANFIYYNNRNFGGTRLEYRITGLTRWIKSNGLKAGDSLEIKRISSYEYGIKIIKEKRKPTTLSNESWVAIYGDEKNG